MPRTARVKLKKVQLEELRLRGSLTIKIPPDVDTLRIEVKQDERDRVVDDLLQKLGISL